ncbi:MAG: hypothetical protein HPZ91_16725 [Lentisphaeria bacterium]|nr:hypothetical protein [Lentisphaeria bacterium]
MKKKVLIPVDEKVRTEAKRKAKIERKLFSSYSEEAYIAGVRLKSYAWRCGLPAEDVLLFLDSCINATQIKQQAATDRDETCGFPAHC